MEKNVSTQRLGGDCLPCVLLMEPDTDPGEPSNPKQPGEVKGSVAPLPTKLLSPKVGGWKGEDLRNPK